MSPYSGDSRLVTHADSSTVFYHGRTYSAKVTDTRITVNRQNVGSDKDYLLIKRCHFDPQCFNATRFESARDVVIDIKKFVENNNKCFYWTQDRWQDRLLVDKMQQKIKRKREVGL